MGAGCTRARTELDYFRPGRWSLPGSLLGETKQQGENHHNDLYYYVIMDEPPFSDDDDEWCPKSRLSKIERKANQGDITSRIYMASYYLYGVKQVDYTGQYEFCKPVWSCKVLIERNLSRAKHLLEPMKGKHFAADMLLRQISLQE